MPPARLNLMAAMFKPLIVVLCSVVLSPALRADDAKPPELFELKDGDRVVLVGGTFVEREGQLGYLEAALTARFADRAVTFRNLGQSGDTARADARNLNAGWVTFGPPDQGFNRLRKLTEEIKPTVIVANFGMTESFDGPAKIPEFVRQYERLLDMLASAAGGSPRVVLLSPNYHEAPVLGHLQPDPKPHNESLRAYRDAIRDLAAKRQARFVDLYAITEQLTNGGARRLTDNGIHLTPDGYQAAVDPLLAALGVPAESPGRAKPTAEQMEALRKLVVAKNAEYFNYWRPQNDTYILGYRKKEQGRNAVELPQFLPLVEAKEKQIAAAKR